MIRLKSYFSAYEKRTRKISNHKALLYLNSIGLFLIQHIMWRSGLGEEFFMSEQEMEKIEKEIIIQNKDYSKKIKLTISSIHLLINFVPMLYYN